MDVIIRPLLRSFNVIMDFYFLLAGHPSGILKIDSNYYSMDSNSLLVKKIIFL